MVLWDSFGLSAKLRPDVSTANLFKCMMRHSLDLLICLFDGWKNGAKLFLPNDGLSWG